MDLEIQKSKGSSPISLASGAPAAMLVKESVNVDIEQPVEAPVEAPV